MRRGAGRGRSGRRLEVEGIVGSSSVFSTGSRRWPRVHLLQAQPPPLVSSPLPPHSLQPDPPSAPPLLRTGPAPDSHLVFLQRSLLPARCGRCCTAGRGRAGGGGDDAGERHDGSGVEETGEKGERASGGRRCDATGRGTRQGTARRGPGGREAGRAGERKGRRSRKGEGVVGGSFAERTGMAG